MSVTAASITTDLRAEHEALDLVVVGLDDHQWSTPTASPGWTVADQIGHLGFFDRRAALAITDPDAFNAHLAEFMAAVQTDPGQVEALTLGEARALHRVERLDLS